MTDGGVRANAGLPARLGRRTALAGVVAGVAAAWTGCSGDTENTPATLPPSGPFDERFPGDPGPGRMYLGVSLAIDQPASAQQELGGESIALARRFYRDHQIGLMREMVQEDAAAGIMPFVSFKAEGTWQAIADGRRDRWLDRILETLDSLAVPALVALHHEPENDIAGENTAAAWVAMQRRLLRRAAGLELVTPVPVLMNWTFQARSKRDPQEWMVPDAPLMGVDVYNPWKPTSGATWVEFAELYGLIREVVPDQPLIVPELGTTADPFDPTRAASWLRGAFDTALREGVVGLAWFDAELKDGRDRRLDAAGKRELRSLLKRPEVARIEPARLTR